MPAYSFSLKCVPCTNESLWTTVPLYILVAYGPLTVFLAVIVTFTLCPSAWLDPCLSDPNAFADSHRRSPPNCFHIPICKGIEFGVWYMELGLLSLSILLVLFASQSDNTSCDGTGLHHCCLSFATHQHHVWDGGVIRSQLETHCLYWATVSSPLCSLPSSFGQHFSPCLL